MRYKITLLFTIQTCVGYKQVGHSCFPDEGLHGHGSKPPMAIHIIPTANKTKGNLFSVPTTHDVNILVAKNYQFYDTHGIQVAAT